MAGGSVDNFTALPKGKIVDKPPNDGNPFAAGGFHFSERRRKHERGKKKRIVKSDVFGNPGNKLEEEFAPSRSRPGKSGKGNSVIAAQGNGKQESSRPGNGRSGNDRRGRSDFAHSGSVQASTDADIANLNPNESEHNKTHGRRNGFTDPGVESGNPQLRKSVGINVRDAASGTEDKSGRKPRNRISRRPGRRRNRDADKIIFPPEPNRQNPGLETNLSTRKKTGARNHRQSAYHRQGGRAQANKIAPLYAALDLGTNNCRLLVALPQQTGRFRVVDAYSRIVRLGRGMESSGRLDENAMDQTVEALGECARKLKNANIHKMRLIATEACRRAENGDEFLFRVKQETGLGLEIVDRETEAYLAAEGCGALVDKKADGAVLFDIGGGSSELILLDRRGRRNKKISEQVSSWTSLPVGVVTLSERHGGKDVSRTMFNQMVEDVESHLSKFDGRDNLHGLWNKGRVHLLGTSGTVTTLAGVHLKLPRYDRRQVDGIWLKDEHVDRTIDQLLDMDYRQRAANPCIGSERADLVLAGCAILQAIRNTWPSPRLRVADRGLREGILTQMMNHDGAWITPKKGRKFSDKRAKRKYPQARFGAQHDSSSRDYRDG